jgi:hypothetical protein
MTKKVGQWTQKYISSEEQWGYKSEPWKLEAKG